MSARSRFLQTHVSPSSLFQKHCCVFFSCREEPHFALVEICFSRQHSLFVRWQTTSSPIVSPPYAPRSFCSSSILCDIGVQSSIVPIARLRPFSIAPPFLNPPLRFFPTYLLNLFCPFFHLSQVCGFVSLLSPRVRVRRKCSIYLSLLMGVFLRPPKFEA